MATSTDIANSSREAQSLTPKERLAALNQQQQRNLPLTGYQAKQENSQTDNSLPDLGITDLSPEEKAALDAELASIGEQIRSRNVPIDAELEDALEAQNAIHSAEFGQWLDSLSAPEAGDLAYQGTDPNATPQERTRYALTALALDLGAQGHYENGTPTLSGEKSDELRSIIAAQALVAQEALEKAIQSKAKEQEQADNQADQQKQKSLDAEPLAVRLTNEQTRLLVANEYPNNVPAQNQALYNITNSDHTVSVLKDTVNLDYSEENKTYFATLDRDAKPALDQKLTQLQAEQEQKRQPPLQEREKSRQRDRSKDYERE